MTPLAVWTLLIAATVTTMSDKAFGDYTYKRPVTYAGPIVYSDEKPPVIQFPGPPPASNAYSTPGGGVYGAGGGDKNSITYVPLPLDDLPILIYQSKDKPPVHVLNRPGKDYGSGTGSSANGGYYASNGGYSSGGYSGSYAPASSYSGGGGATGSGAGNYPSSYSYAPKPFYIGKPAAPSTVYLPQVKPNSYSYGGGYSGNTGSKYSNSYAGNSGANSGNNGGSYSYNTAGSGSSYYGGQVKQQPPHIVYSGHPPIHVYQQPSYSQQQPPQAQSQLYTGGYKAQSYANSYGPPPQKQNTYVPAPPGYHKPPIIIYQGVRPPVHVYNEPSAPGSYSASGPSSSSSGSSGYEGTVSGSGYVGGYSSKNGEQWEPVGSQVEEQVDIEQGPEVKAVTFDKDHQEVIVLAEQALETTETDQAQQKQETSA